MNLWQILLDDSPEKCDFNPPFTTLHPVGFDVYELYSKYEAQNNQTIDNETVVDNTTLNRETSAETDDTLQNEDLKESESTELKETTETSEQQQNNNKGKMKEKKKGVKRQRGQVSKYEVCCELDTELKRGNPLWSYLNSLASYSGQSDEYLRNNPYNAK